MAAPEPYRDVAVWRVRESGSSVAAALKAFLGALNNNFLSINVSIKNIFIKKRSSKTSHQKLFRKISLA
jgi:hypothetical protein